MTDTLELVKKFNEAFGIECEKTPGIPSLDGFNLIGGNYAKLELKCYALNAESITETLVAKCEKFNAHPIFLRLQLIQEELTELAWALYANDIIKVFDALADLRYVIDGTVLAFGLGDVFEQGMQEVHRSNMSKLVDGKPVKNESGKIIKVPGSDYSPPDFKGILDTHFAQGGGI